MTSVLRRNASLLLFSLVLVLFFLFSPSRVRFVSIVGVGSILLPYLYSLLVPLLITARHEDSVIRGIRLQHLPVRLEIVNRSFLPISYFTITDATDELFAEKHVFLVNLAPYERKRISFEARGDRRGRYWVGPLRLKGTDPFGIFPWTKRIESTLEAIVYPTIHSVALNNRRGLPSGSINTSNKMYEDVTRFRSLREYVPGDDIKRINWKASAKTNKIYTMEFDATLYFSALIVLDFSRDDFPARLRNQMIERAAEVAASLTFYFADLKQEIGFVTSGAISAGSHEEASSPVVVTARAGYEHAQEILEVIAKLESVEGRADFSSLLFRSDGTVAMGSKVLVITPRVTEEQAGSLIAARRKGINIQVLELETSERRDQSYVRGVLTVIPVKEVGTTIRE